MAAAQAAREPAGRAGKAVATALRALLSGTRGCCAPAHGFNVMQGGSGRAACTRDEQQREASMSAQARNPTPRSVKTGPRTRRCKMSNPWLFKPKVSADFFPYVVINDAKGERFFRRAACSARGAQSVLRAPVAGAAQPTVARRRVTHAYRRCGSVPHTSGKQVMSCHALQCSE